MAHPGDHDPTDDQPRDEAHEGAGEPTPPAGSDREGGSTASLDDLLRAFGMPPGSAGAVGSASGIDLEAVLRQAFGASGSLPPEVRQLVAALSGDPAGAPMLAMMRRQLGALVGEQGPHARVEAATDLARRVVAAGEDRVVGAGARHDVEQAVSVARLWLDPVTALDSPPGPALAWSGAEWVEATMPRWWTLVEPVAEGMAAAGSAAMRTQLDRLGELGGLAGLADGSGGDVGPAGAPGEDPASSGLPPWLAQLPGLLGGGGVAGGAAAGGLSGGLAGLLGQLRPMLEQAAAGMFGAQLGQAVGGLARDVLSGTEVGLPLAPDGAVALLPARVREFADGLGVDEGQVRLYLAVREAARVRLFAEVPWLASQLEAAVRDYGRHVTIDTDAIEAAIREVDLSDLAAVQDAFGRAEKFGRAPTPAQLDALDRLETTLALVEGWVDLVTDQAVAAHLPQAVALGEAVRRRRAGGPAQKAFAQLVGLELRPRRLRDARNLWAALEDAGGVGLRDGSWAYPDLAPTAADLDDPLGYVERRVHPPAPDALDAELDALLGRGLGDGAQDGLGEATATGPGPDPRDDTDTGGTDTGASPPR